MAFRDMVAELRGLPKMNLPLAKTFLNRALQKILDENLWSFQLQESGWITPTLVGAMANTTPSSPGGITVDTFGTTIVGDAAAAAAWAAIPAGYPITSMQIRFAQGDLYNVIDYEVDTPSAGLATLTIDRPWMEVSGVDASYLMYQAYYPAPTDGFKRWLAVRSMTIVLSLDWWSLKQQDLNIMDPQRTRFQNPSAVVPFTVDNRPGSATKGRMLFELWPGPLSTLPYALYFVSDPPPLSNPSDELPYPLTEELVLYRAKQEGYIWAEENKGRYPELMKTDWGFLLQASAEEYKDRIKDIRKRDRDTVDSFVTVIRRRYPTIGGQFYSAVTGGANVGVFGA